MSRKLNKALREQKQNTQQVPQEIYGTLLAINGLVEVRDRPSFVYVQLRDNQNEIIEAFNNKVAASPGLPVIVHREGNRYVIQGVNTQRYQNIWNNYAPYLPKHGTAHSFADGGGGDVSWIFSRQFMPNLVYPNDGGTTGTSAYIAPHILLTNNGTWAYTGATGTVDLLQYKGTGSSSAMLLVYLDATTGNPGILVGSGSYFSNALTGTATIYPYIPIPDPATQIPLAAVRMDTGTASITWDNLYDVRQWIHALPSGTSGGGGGGIDTIGFAGLANGVPIGTGTILNIIGAGATFTRSGTVFNLDIPGGGGTAPVTGSMVIQNNGLNLGSATILNFTNGVFASISGSVAQISVTGTSSTYVRTAPPISLSSITGTYWRTQERIFASGSLAVFNQGHALIPSVDYVEQYPASGTFQYLNLPPTGTYALAIYGIPTNVISGGSSEGGASQIFPQDCMTFINQFKISSGVVGGFTRDLLSTQPFVIYYYQVSPADGDKVKTTILLKADTYDVYVLGVAGNNRGKIDWDLDGDSPFISGQDWYDASGNVPNIIKTGTCTIGSSGRHVLSATINGKNGSSSNYYMTFTSIWFVSQSQSQET